MSNCIFILFLCAIHNYWFDIRRTDLESTTYLSAITQWKWDAAPIWFFFFSYHYCQICWLEKEEEAIKMQNLCLCPEFCQIGCSFTFYFYLLFFQGHLGGRRWLYLAFSDLWSHNILCPLYFCSSEPFWFFVKNLLLLQLGKTLKYKLMDFYSLSQSWFLCLFSSYRSSNICNILIPSDLKWKISVFPLISQNLQFIKRP